MTQLVEKVTEPLKRLGVDASYGAPVEIDGATIVPVALVWFGFGGGNGNMGAKSDADAEGEGFGGGGVSVPIGAYVTTSLGVRFQPNLIALLAVGIPFVLVAGHVLAKLVRAAKK
ncbi:hypothetical protein DVJ78_14555 [Humibacter sp. BT305]|uniref:spore germination protein GerW family protein n=1 Tax=Cnuibacter physcomitrellae TaxID=1619308 RepID=UPI000E1039FC|nr:spore germination protein GerW family protein [Cnuibacter physcomitrellae]AXH36473.1 hypothetical protein DVJ78_14555 [Humibacter sp. BT305]MCS5499088.1 spore germination protein GerW family protein [Cnuibacter physcomitrellae]